jgi:hypothetical protein
MGLILKTTHKLLNIGWLLFLILSACAPTSTTISTPDVPKGLPVDSIFNAFYDQLGGEAIMGPILSPTFELGGLTSQYTEGGLMLYDSEAPLGQQFSLAPLGRKLDLPDVQNLFSAQNDGLVVNGFVIYSKFVDLYKQFDLTRYAGRPLSQPLIDSTSNRIIQYFETVGFYTSLDNNDGMHLLAYGGFDCAEKCNFQLNSMNNPQSATVFEEPFLDSMLPLGRDLTGRPISTYYSSPEGNVEQVYENLVVYASPDDVHQINFRPLPELVGYPPTSPVAKTDDNGLVFIPINNSLGHNVAVVFEEFISNHGGSAIAGLPTTEIFSVGGEYWQCFTHFCLDYDALSPDSEKVKPAALGKIYFEQLASTEITDSDQALSSNNVILRVTEKFSAVSITDREEIDIQILHRQDQLPIPNIPATLTITLPDNSQKSYTIPATDLRGESLVTIDPVQAVNGTIIPFRVCLNLKITPQICISDTFVVWTWP